MTLTTDTCYTQANVTCTGENSLLWSLQYPEPTSLGTAQTCNVNYKVQNWYQHVPSTFKIKWPNTYIDAVTQTATGYASNLLWNYHYEVTAPCAWNFTDTDLPETQAQKDARIQREVARVLAGEKAEQLLMLVLNEKEQAQYKQLGYFETVVNDKVYRIKKGRSGNVFQLEQGVEKLRFCAHPSLAVPDQDTMIAQLLMLRNNEQEFLKTANKTILHP